MQSIDTILARGSEKPLKMPVNHWSCEDKFQNLGRFENSCCCASCPSVRLLPRNSTIVAVLATCQAKASIQEMIR
jgi:hypothetical protein